MRIIAEAHFHHVENCIHQTVEAEVTMVVHSQRAGVAESLAEPSLNLNARESR